MSPTLKHAFFEVFGVNDFTFEKYPQSDGSTDYNIVCDVAGSHGFSEKEINEKYPVFVEKTLEMLQTYENYKSLVLPCVGVLLGVLKKKGAVCGVLTGNSEKKGKWKLKETGLNRWLKFGAYGDFIKKRPDLFPIALKKAEEISGLKFEKENIFIIGDTCHDIEVAKVNGVKVIAVATGRVTVEELRECKPDAVFSDLTKTKEFLKIIGIK